MDSHPSSPITSHDPRVTAIVRRHTHDVRNYINSLDLEASLLEELITDPDAITSVKRMRAQLSQLEATVRELSVKFTEARPVALTAGDLLHMWKRQVAAVEDDSQPVKWVAPEESKVIMIDPGIIVTVLRELLVGARKRSSSRGLTAGVKTSADAVTAELIEPAQAVFVEDEIEELRRVITNNGGTLEQSHDAAGAWVTKIAFPVADEGKEVPST